MLAHERGGARVFAAGGEALHQFEHHQQHRRPDSQHRVAGQQADGERGAGHDHQRHGKDLLAADPVAQPAEEHATHGPDDERGGKGAQQEQVLDGPVRLGQEHRPHGGDEVAEDADVVPLHGVAHVGAAERLPSVRRFTTLTSDTFNRRCCPWCSAMARSPPASLLSRARAVVL